MGEVFHTTCFRNSRPPLCRRRHRTLLLEPLEARQLLAVGPIISEFLARNDDQLLDFDGDSSDWIELFNPQSEAVDLDGWFLTDNAAVADKWALPPRALDSGEAFIIFASGKNRYGVGPDFDDSHANFSLDGGGEYLALVHPESGTIASEFLPAYPQQIEDVSYGLLDTTLVTELVAAGATAEVFIPANNDLGTIWTRPEFSPGADWLVGATGVGFDVAAVDGDGDGGGESLKVDFSQGDVEPLQSDWQGFAFGPDGGASVTRSFASDSLAGIGNLVEVTIAGNTHWRDYSPATGPFASLSDLLSDGPLCNLECNMRLGLDGLQDGAYEITLYNHTTEHGALGWRPFTPFDILLTDGVDVGKLVADDVIMSDNNSDLLATETIRFTVVAGSPVEINYRKPGDGDHMALAGFELVRRAATSVIGSVSTDLAAAMHEVNSSAYVRTEFAVAAGAEFTRLRLQMQYNGGFVAYLNGTEIARRNAPETLSWNATAEAEHHLAEAVVFEEIDVSAHLVAILPGQINVLAIHGLSQSADDDDFLILPELSAEQIGGRLRYFDPPTPGEVNTGGFDGFVADTRFSVDRGIFRSAANAFDLEITTATPEAAIVYTTDGSAPQVDQAGTIVNGRAYGTSIRVDRTTTLRAAAFKPGFIPTNIDTHTYIFLDDVLNQSSTPPDGFPATWGGTPTDWGLDQDPASVKLIAGDANFTLAEAREVIAASLTALPTMSIVMDVDDIFGASRGIYANTLQSGFDWERPTSVELIEPDGTTAFQVDAGIRIQGNTSRDPGRNPKHSLRLVFRKRYGDAKLNYQFFDNSPVDEFDTLVLRSNSQDAWVYDTASNRLGTFIRDQWTRETQLAMGQPAAHGNWVHLYINGLYWGVYNPTERPDASFDAAYLGGKKDNYDALKNHEEVIDGNDQAYRELLALIQNDPNNHAAGYRDLSSDAAYQQVLGYVDAVSLADYMIHNMYAAATDWPGNYYIGRDRTGEEGFRFFGWDNERGFKAEVTLNRTRPHGDDADSPTKFHQALRSNAEYRLLFADQLHRALANGGVLYVDPDNSQWDPEHPERNVPAARFVEIAQSIDRALIAESARWGDVRDQLYTPHDQLLTLRDSLLTGWFPQRSRILLDQFRAQGLYPSVAAAEFNQHGGSIDLGFQLIASAPQGAIYYTTDGSDPRVALSGEVSPTAQVFDGPLTLTESTQVKTRVLFGGTWSALDEATFHVEQPTLTLAISEIHFNPADPPEASPWNNDDFEFVEFFNYGSKAINLSGVRLIDGVSFDFTDSGVTRLGTGRYTVVVKDMAAFASRYDVAGINIAGQYSGLDDQLKNSGERIVLVDRFDQTIADFTFDDRWHNLADGAGFSLTRTDPGDGGADLQSRAAWRPSSDLGGSPGKADHGATPDPEAIVINEILFRPLSPRVEPATAGNAEPTGEEYVELYNNSDVEIDVGGWRFTSGFSYTIPAGTIVPPRGYLVVASDLNVFAAKYGAVVHLVGGDGSKNASTDWIGTLSNSGENIRLERPGGDLVDRVYYADSGDWAVRRWLPNFDGIQPVDGWQWVAPHADAGHSLELMNPNLTNRAGQNWAPSAAPRGTPGAANSAASDNIAPMIVDVVHSPVIPHSDEPVLITAEILNEGDGPVGVAVDVTLHYRVDPQQPLDMRDPHSTTPFIALPMVDDGSGGDAVAGDGVFSATVPGQVNRALVDFYVEAGETNGANVRSYPAPSDDVGNHDANLLYQVDDSVDLDFGVGWPGDQPIYRLVMTAGQEAKLRQRDENDAGTRADDEVNATFIVRDPSRGTGTEVFHNVGVRIRGNSSRTADPFNLRIEFPSDHKFRGLASIPLNSQAVYSQLVGHTVFQEAGLSSEGPVKPVVVSLNGTNIANENTDQTYGSFVQLHARDGDLGAEQYSLDGGGNLYALSDHDDASPPGTLTFVATATSFKDSYLPAAPQTGIDTGYHKQSNKSEDDWQDLVELTRALSIIETPDSTAEDSLNFVHQVSQVINVNQWLRHMAVTALIRNEEGGYATGRGDDYGLYRGQFDTRFELVPHDLDAIMDIGQGAGFGGTSAPIVEQRQGIDWQGFRVIEHPAFAPIFYGHLNDLMDTVFNPQNLNPIIDRLLGDGALWVPTEVIDRFKDFVSGRETWVRDQIDRNVEGIPDPVSPSDLAQLPAPFQSLALQQRYLRISEIMYHPRDEELEFVELVNMGDAPLDLTGVHFKGGILFGFNTGAPIESPVDNPVDNPVEQTPETVLGPGERVLIVKNKEAFEAHYGTDLKIAGEFWSGRLSNSGERILLEGRLGEPILDFSFSDDWYVQTDGEGFSLVLSDDVDQNTPRAAWGEQSTWQASELAGGTPPRRPSLPSADLTGNGFVDFADLTILLANWNRRVSADEGNLVDDATTPVNFQDLTVLLAAWTGPGAAASPQPAAAEAAIERNTIERDTATTQSRIATNVHFDRLGRRSDATSRRINHASKLSLRDSPFHRLQSVAVDRVIEEGSELEREARISRRAPRRRR